MVNIRRTKLQSIWISFFLHIYQQFTLYEYTLGSGNTLPVAALLAHGMSTNGNGNINITGAAFKSNQGHISNRLQKHTVSGQPLIANIASSYNQQNMQQSSTVPTTGYGDGRMESGIHSSVGSTLQSKHQPIIHMNPSNGNFHAK